MNVYPITVERDGKPVTLGLRLDVSHIRKLCSDHGDDINSILLNGAGDPGVLAEVLTAALSYRKSDNEITDGDEVYDLLVDKGYAGQLAWLRLVLEIGKVSGTLSASQADTIIREAQSAEKQAFAAASSAPDGPIEDPTGPAAH